MHARWSPLGFALAVLVLAPAALFAGGERNVLDLARELDATVEWDLLSSTAVLHSGPDQLSIAVGSPWVVVNQRVRYGVEPAYRRSGGVYLTEAASALIQEIVASRAARRWHIGVIMIDPGHGGADPGTLSPPGKDMPVLKEKDVVLATSLQLVSLLRGEFPDKRILMTRSSDVSVELEERAEMANAVKLERNEAMIYVSLHANYGFDRRAKGFEVWVYPSQERRTVLDSSEVSQDLKEIYPILNGMREDEFNTQSSVLAQAILGGLEVEVGDVTQSRGQKTESWAVVREALMPAVLIELGFVSNAEEARLLGEPVYQQKLAVGIGRGIMEFVARFESAMSFLD